MLAGLHWFAILVKTINHDPPIIYVTSRYSLFLTCKSHPLPESTLVTRILFLTMIIQARGREPCRNVSFREFTNFINYYTLTRFGTSRCTLSTETEKEKERDREKTEEIRCRDNNCALSWFVRKVSRVYSRVWRCARNTNCRMHRLFHPFLSRCLIYTLRNEILLLNNVTSFWDIEVSN